MTVKVIKPVSIETIKEDMRRLSDDFKKVMYSLGEKSKKTVKQGGERFGSALKSLGESARGTASDVYERINSRGKYVMKKSRRAIELKPVTYVLTALAAGVLAGAFIRRSSVL